MLSGALPINSQGSSNTECPEAAALNYNQELNFRRWHQQQLPASPYELIISCIFRSYSIGENDSIKVCGLLSDKPLAQVNKMVKITQHHQVYKCLYMILFLYLNNNQAQISSPIFSIT